MKLLGDILYSKDFCDKTAVAWREHMAVGAIIKTLYQQNEHDSTQLSLTAACKIYIKMAIAIGKEQELWVTY